MRVQRAYNILSNLVSQGFDTVGLSLPEDEIILKTLNKREYQLVRFLGGKSLGISFKAARLAYGTFMVNGTNVLADRPRNIEDLYSFYLSLPSTMFYKALKVLSQLERASREAQECLEGFCYSPQSRSAWLWAKGSVPCSDSLTGILGTGMLGLNDAQRYWMTLNTALDKEEEDSKMWSHSMFVASATNPDGVKKATISMDQGRKMAREEREELFRYGNAFRRRALKGIRERKRWSSEIRTSEDLVRELNRQMTGDLDKHDQFMKGWYERKRLEHEESLRQKRERAEELRRSSPRRQLLEQSMAVSEQEMQDHISGKKDLFAIKKARDTKDTRPSKVHNSHRIIGAHRR